MKKILFLAANPKGTSQLQLDKELRKIEESLERSKLRDQFQLTAKWAVDPTALRRALLEEKPDIVHFSGHGTGAEGLVLVGQDDIPRPATGEALASLFAVVHQQKPISCVLLNACYAEEQAKAIFKHIDNVIGMRRAVKDDAAIAFAVAFYDGLGYGIPIDAAFQLGRVAIQLELASFSKTTRKAIPVDLETVEEMEVLPDHLIPVLLTRAIKQTPLSESITSNPVSISSLSEQLRTTTEVNQAEAVQKYRGRVKDFLEDGELTPIEKIQLATLANVLGISEIEANKILDESLAPLLTDLYKRATQYYHSQRWQQVLDVFRKIEAYNPDYSDPDNLKTSARQQLKLRERRQREQELTDLQQQAYQYIDEGDWPQALRKLEAIQHIQPAYQDTLQLLQKAQRVIYADERLKVAVGLIVSGWIISGIIGNIPGNPYSFSVHNLAGWIGGFLGGVAIPLISVQIETASSREMLQLFGSGVAGCILGGLLWHVIEQTAPSSAENSVLMVQLILSVAVNIGALFLRRYWIRSN